MTMQTKVFRSSIFLNLFVIFTSSLFFLSLLLYSDNVDEEKEKKELQQEVQKDVEVLEELCKKRAGSDLQQSNKKMKKEKN